MVSITLSKVFFVALLIININIVLGLKKKRRFPRKPSNENSFNDEISFRFPLQISAYLGPHVGPYKPKPNQLMDNDISIKTDSCNKNNSKEELKKLKLKVKCMPRPVIVTLEHTMDSTLIPNTVLVNRCGGWCSGTPTKCIAMNKTYTEFNIRVLKNNKPLCKIIRVPEDLSCTCDCPQKANECNRKQIYDKRTCKCICDNTNEMKNCDAKINKSPWFWDPNTCTCLCSEEKTCTTGSAWNLKLCKCVKDD